MSGIKYYGTCIVQLKLTDTSEEVAQKVDEEITAFKNRMQSHQAPTSHKSLVDSLARSWAYQVHDMAQLTHHEWQNNVQDFKMDLVITGLMMALVIVQITK
jgi:hypothetical protein